MSALDALLGKISNNGVELELGGGIDFVGSIRAFFNDATKLVEVSLLSADVLSPTSIQVASFTAAASFVEIRHDGNTAMTHKPRANPDDGELFAVAEVAGGTGTITIDGNGKNIGNPGHATPGTPETSFTTSDPYFSMTWRYSSAQTAWLIKDEILVVSGGGGGGGLTMIAQIDTNFTATIGERQLFDPSPGSRTASGPASGMTLGQEFAVTANTSDVTPWTMAKGSQATSIQHPQTLLFVASFTVDSGAIDLHYAFDGGKLVLI